jgi:hypothetical protein
MIKTGVGFLRSGEHSGGDVMPVLVVEDHDATALILQSLLRRSHRIGIKRPVDDPYELV